MICWYAGYPKSGTTWIRLLLANCERQTGINDLPEGWADLDPKIWFVATGRDASSLTPIEVDQYRPLVQELLAERKIREAMRPYQPQPDDIWVKTHHAVAEVRGFPTINPRVTRGAICVVRDPRDVAVSFAHHYGLELGAAVDHLGSPSSTISDTLTNALGGNVTLPLYHYLGSWTDHARSWRDSGAYMVRYEDLQTDPVGTLRKLLKHLSMNAAKSVAERAVNRCSFGELRAMEEREGFREAVRGRFFRQGRSGAWREVLTPEQAARIVEVHGAAMQEFGYEAVPA